MMGPNGAGKTTVFNLLTGLLKPDAGEVIFRGRDITRESPTKRCCEGIGRTHQIPRPFSKMTVFENLLVASIYGGGLGEKQAQERLRESEVRFRAMPSRYSANDRAVSAAKPSCRRITPSGPEKIGIRQSLSLRTEPCFAR